MERRLKENSLYMLRQLGTWISERSLKAQEKFFEALNVLTNLYTFG